MSPPSRDEPATDRERRIAEEVERMLRMSRTRERQKVFMFSAGASFALGVLAGSLVSEWLAFLFTATSGMLFILAGRYAIAGGDVATPFSMNAGADVGSFSIEGVNTAALEAMSPRQRTEYSLGAGSRLVLFGALVLIGSVVGLLMNIGR